MNLMERLKDCIKHLNGFNEQVLIQLKVEIPTTGKLGRTSREDKFLFENKNENEKLE